VLGFRKDSGQIETRTITTDQDFKTPEHEENYVTPTVCTKLVLQHFIS